MAIGDSPFQKVTTDMQQVFAAQSITVQVIPSQAGQPVPRDKHLQPIAAPPAPTNLQIVLDRVDEDIQATAEGGKPVQTMEFFALPGTLNENDTILWNGHKYRTNSLWPSTFGGIVQVLFCKALRMVGT